MTNIVETAMLDVNRTGQDCNATNVIQIIMDLHVLSYATLTVLMIHVMTPMVPVLWDVKRGSMETNVTDNVRVVRQVVTNLQDDVMETVKTLNSHRYQRQKIVPVYT